MRYLVIHALLALHLRARQSGEAQLIILRIHFLLHHEGVVPNGNRTQCFKNMMRK